MQQETKFIFGLKIYAFSISVHFVPAVEGTGLDGRVLSHCCCCGGEMLVSTSRSRSTQLSRHSSSIQSYHLYFSSMISVWPFSRLVEESLRKVSHKMQNVKVGTHLAGYFLGFFFDAGTSAFLGGFSAKLTFRLWPVRISGKS